MDAGEGCRAGARFATTRWSLILAAGARGSKEASSALERLFEVYWYPLYAFVRRKGHRPEDAFDLTQEFIARLLAKNLIASADASRGRFRTFLLAALERFLINEWKSGRRLKRGGGRRLISLEPEGAESRFRLEPADDRTPERLFERRWALILLERALERLEVEHRGTPREPLYLAARHELGGEGAPASNAELARALGMTEGAVKTAVHRMRRRYGEILREEIAETTSDPADVEDEIRYLFEALGS